MKSSEFADRDREIFDLMGAGIYQRGYCVLENALPACLAHELESFSRRVSLEKFERAGIGRASHYEKNDAIRKDAICWISDDSAAGCAGRSVCKNT